MTSLFSCPADWTYWQLKRQWRGTRRWQVPRSTLTRAKVCGWVLGGGHPPARALLLEWRTCPHPRGVVQTRPPARAKLVGSMGSGRSPGGCLVLRAVFLKGQGGGVRRVHLLLNPLLVVRTTSALGSSGGTGTIPFQTPLDKLVCRQVCHQCSREGCLGMPDLESHWLAWADH